MMDCLYLEHICSLRWQVYNIFPRLQSMNVSFDWKEFLIQQSLLVKQDSALVNYLFPYRKWNLKKASEEERSRKDVITYTWCPSGPENQQRCWHRRWHVQLGERNTENNFNLCTSLWRSCMVNYSTYFNNVFNIQFKYQYLLHPEL